jgi:hypothetical protein
MILTKVQKQFCEKNETTRTTKTQRIQMECHEMCICSTKNVFFFFCKIYLRKNTFFSFFRVISCTNVSLSFIAKTTEKMKKTFWREQMQKLTKRHFWDTQSFLLHCKLSNRFHLYIPQRQQVLLLSIFLANSSWTNLLRTTKGIVLWPVYAINWFVLQPS